jgi:hypothetical protein
MIECSEEVITYTVEGDDESYWTDDITVENEISQEEGEYKAPKTDIIVAKFSATSEHGTFQWSVKAVRVGFLSSYELDDDELEENIPKNCTWEQPKHNIS